MILDRGATEQPMGDTHQGQAGGNSAQEDGSGAARRAQATITNPKPDPKSGPKPGFFKRLFGTAPPALNGTKPAINGHSLTPAGGLANLNRVRVQDVAVPRAEIESVPIEIELEPLVTMFRDSGLTRLPVFDETLDRPLGFVHLKDLALKHGFACDDNALDLRSMLRPLLFAPPSMPIGVLFQKMQTDRLHMALVIDEYGGVDGLVTIEDLIEEVVGEIEDEHDVEEDQFWSVESPGIYLCLAKTPLEDFEAEIATSLMEHLDDDDVETLGGLVFVLAGRVPVRGEVIKHKNGVEFEVLDADPRRIKRLRVVMPQGKHT